VSVNDGIIFRVLLAKEGRLVGSGVNRAGVEVSLSIAANSERRRPDACNAIAADSGNSNRDSVVHDGLERIGSIMVGGSQCPDACVTVVMYSHYRLVREGSYLS
jgi:hypothetical protein